ncbi:MAG: DegT/DnrJ/EryC1/StrS family aminotransferase [Gemmatimonadaceae bacterium]|nr:DegT/DnrJ/EryC1/StrS family aminotransferase [Gemmatimonadaceae bacterium]
MPVPLLDLKAQHARIRDEVANAIMKVVDDQNFILGTQVGDFEKDVATLSHTKHAIGCANGSDALLIALRALDVGAGHEVITTPFTFFATAGMTHNSGAKPVFADIDADTFSMNPEAAAAAVTSRTKAVIPVDLFGQMSPIERYVKAIDLPIIEDAAQSIGARRRVDGEWTMAGERAMIGTFSFFPSKNLGGYGDGGMIVTQSDDLAMKLRRLRTHGAIKTYVHEVVGFNSRLDTLQAAVLAAKLPYLAGWSAARRTHAAYYDAAFADLSDIRTPAIDSANESIYNQYTIRTERRDALQAHLKANEIGTAIYYPIPLHLQECFAYLGYKPGAFPESERASKEVLSLPVYPELTQSQQDETIDAVRSFFGR